MWLCSSAVALGCLCCIEENQSRKVLQQYYASTEELVQVAASGVKSLAHRAMGARQSTEQCIESPWLLSLLAAGLRLIPPRDSQLQPVHQCNPTSNTPSQFGQQENLCFYFIYTRSAPSVNYFGQQDKLNNWYTIAPIPSNSWSEWSPGGLEEGVCLCVVG